MKILLANAHPFLPQMTGGAQSSMHDLACEFRRRGHDVGVLGGLTKAGWTGLKSRVELKTRGRVFAVDRALGYPVYRAWHPWEVVAEVARHMKADVVVPQSMYPVRFAHALLGEPTRVVIYLRNVEPDDLGGDLQSLTGVSYVANSRFTSKRCEELFGVVSEVVYPLIRKENYVTPTSRENVTFINPHPRKGLEIALGLAERCPDIPFVFVLSWMADEAQRAKLQDRITGLPNITLTPPTSDMKSVYGKAKIVIAPSQWEEAFGRVGVEPQFSGIPVVASARGGLPEAVGPGGILVPADGGLDAWVRAVRSLWDDKDLYDRTSRAARAHSLRPEMDPAAQIDHLLEIFAGRTRSM